MHYRNANAAVTEEALELLPEELSYGKLINTLNTTVVGKTKEDNPEEEQPTTNKTKSVLIKGTLGAISQYKKCKE